MAKILILILKVTKKPSLVMVIFKIKVTGSNRDLSSQAGPRNGKLNLKLCIL